jgi:hypothetical protein
VNSSDRGQWNGAKRKGDDRIQRDDKLERRDIWIELKRKEAMLKFL